MEVYRYEFAKEKPDQFARRIPSERSVPVKYKNQVVSSTVVGPDEHILLELPDEAITDLQSGLARVNPYGQKFFDMHGVEREEIFMIEIFNF